MAYKTLKETKLGTECSLACVSCLHMHLEVTRSQINLCEEDGSLEVSIH